MNLLKTKLGRTSAVIAGSIIGLAGVAVFASPASAHAPTVKGESSCVADSGEWTATWHIGNDYNNPAHASSITVTEYKKGTALDTKTVEIPADTVFKPNSSNNIDEQVMAETKVTNKDVTKVEIKVVLLWEDGYTNDGKYGHGKPVTATTRKGDACKPNPTPSDSQSASPSPSASESSSATPSETASTPSDTPTTPDIPVAPSDVTPILVQDCTTMTLGLKNPADSIPLKLDYDTSKGEHRTLTVKPGAEGSEKFSAVPGFWVKLTLTATINGETQSDFVKVDYQKPANCDNGEGGGLPVTGAAAGGIAGGAAVLLAAGGVLFVMARRRKVKFTA
ncbi:hypothetical protein HH310_15530 [Actinoplanes sp. TBRC 11911]|uniref:hypothetical protein n=1 Tax=Actinoplanes sp. TBRC 11911 TaxID=2729386 RepID=UPI00145C3EC4|nr:hypothetical protein [Actinoplanes sp. TBRC 11911]NMO52600.1 hypothetical protein [Actinoplanes sp. TBRC 11911]